MDLGLSSAVAPDLPLADLVDACRRRGLTALEIVLGDARGVRSVADADGFRNAVGRAASNGVRVAALAYEGRNRIARREAIRLAATAGVPALLPSSAMDRDEIEAAAARASETGARLVLLFRGDPDRADELVAILDALPGAGAGLAWEVDPAVDDPGEAAELLAIVGHRLALVRLRGGGPESAGQTGLGIGSLVARLALARYRGPIILTPSTPRYRRAWAAWLGRNGAWGCGSKQADHSLVSLAATGPTNP